MAVLDLRTPGVYIIEKNAFPASAVAVASAIPVFIGYTEIAHGPNGKDLTLKPTRISSLADYVTYFGGGFKPVATVNLQAPDAANAPGTTQPVVTTTGAPAYPVRTGFSFNDAANHHVTATVSFKPTTVFLMYNALRMFFMNGGSDCYILSVKTYGGTQGFSNNKNDYFSADGSINVFTILKNETEPTLIIMPDVVTEGTSCYDNYYKQALMHCAETQSRFCIFDVCQGAFDRYEAGDVESFRSNIGTTALNYGAAYYPWLNTSLVMENEVDFENIDGYETIIKQLPEFAGVQDEATTSVATTPLSPVAKVYASVAGFKTASAGMAQKEKDEARLTLNEAIKQTSPTYKALIKSIVHIMNVMPPSGAMAGIYALTDNLRGMWKAPANVSVASVSSATIDISAEGQKLLNVDDVAGKSINVIKPFPGIGTLVWGARTLDGNSQDWRYINVRRTLIMIEQSLKLSARAFVFEPNDSGTWVTIKAMFDNFLNGLWAQGALAGAVPEQAYSVEVGLGITMTPTDILEGVMRISVKLAVVKPAEFIVLTFQQQQQQA